MKAGKIIQIYQKVGYEGWEDNPNLPKAGKMIQIYQKVGYEGWEDDQNLPEGWLLGAFKTIVFFLNLN